jgi:hypothetical protein
VGATTLPGVRAEAQWPCFGWANSAAGHLPDSHRHHNPTVGGRSGGPDSVGPPSASVPPAWLPQQGSRSIAAGRRGADPGPRPAGKGDFTLSDRDSPRLSLSRASSMYCQKSGAYTVPQKSQRLTIDKHSLVSFATAAHFCVDQQRKAASAACQAGSAKAACTHISSGTHLVRST